MKLYIRKVEHVISRYEMVETSSTNVSYVERDKRPDEVEEIELPQSTTHVLEDWREATDAEAALYSRLQNA